MTHLDHNKLVLLRWERSTIIVIQEHKLKEHETYGMKEPFRLAGWMFKCSRSDETPTRPGAGVGILVQEGMGKLIPAEILTEDFKHFGDQGRADKYVGGMGWEEQLSILINYGKSGAGLANKGITEELAMATKEEIQQEEVKGPTAIMGDFNATPSKIESYGELFHAGWTDLGEKAHW